MSGKILFPLLALLALVAACTSSATPEETDPAFEVEQEPEVLLALADVGDCRPPAAQIARALAEEEGTIILAGDLAYPNGSDEDFATCFAPLYNPIMSRLYAVPGNNEYKNGSAAAPYFAALGDRGGNAGEGWLSFTLDNWHIIGLNSECPQIGGCEHGSAQYEWLKNELANNNTQCRIAFWHQPRFTSSQNYQGFERLAPMYELLQDASTDVVLSGNSHHYERFDRLDVNGQLDRENGIINMTVGIGGAAYSNFNESPLTGSLIRNNDSRGFIRFELKESRLDWEFIRVGPGTLEDTGSTSC